jgi:putative membrane protein
MPDLSSTARVARTAGNSPCKNDRMTPEQDPRVYFAGERTFLAWIRTGLAMMGFGFVVARFGLFLRELAAARGDVVATGNGSLWAGTALVLLGVIVNVHAAVEHVRFRRRLDAGTPTPSRSRFGILLASLLAAIGMAMSLYLIARG